MGLQIARDEGPLALCFFPRLGDEPGGLGLRLIGQAMVLLLTALFFEIGTEKVGSDRGSGPQNEGQQYRHGLYRASTRQASLHAGERYENTPAGPEPVSEGLAGAWKKARERGVASDMKN